MTTTMILLVLVSFIAGLVDSVAGGGGLLTVPALLITGIPPHQAIATNKCGSTFGSAVALANFARSKKVVWRACIVGIPVALIGAYLGHLAVLSIDSAALGKIIIFLLPIAMAFTLLPKKNSSETPHSFSKLDIFLYALLIAGTVGFYDGFFGPGTGSFMILGLHMLLKLDLVQASATAKVFNVASNVSALIGFIRAGTVLFSIGIPMALANMAGGHIGSHLTLKKGPAIVRAFLIVSLSILFLTLIIKYGGRWKT